MKNGLIVFDLQGGDAAFVLVDAQRWHQIFSVYDGWADEHDVAGLSEVVGWLTTDDASCDRPAKAPEERVGTIIRTWHTQNYVIEPVHMEDVAWLLTLPCL